MRLVDADDLIFNFCDHPEYSASMFCKIRTKIQETPTVDAQLIVHAKWINKKGKLKCSNCDSFAAWEQGTGGFWEMDNSKFCHNCGAKMDGE